MSRHSPIAVAHKGGFRKTEKLFRGDRKKKLMKVLDRFGQMGVDALSAATPVRTGKTAASWRYEIEFKGDIATIHWINDNKTETGDNIVKMLVRGHGTGNGRYVSGRDFVTPAMEPVLQEIANEAWAEVIE